jgi:hypothetical protein
MVLAIIFHARRPDELAFRRIAGEVALGAVAALVAYGRFVVAPI